VPKISRKKGKNLYSQALFCFGGGKGNRTPDLLNAIQALYQLSYTPKFFGNVIMIKDIVIFVKEYAIYCY
jgi:hypothetical protein